MRNYLVFGDVDSRDYSVAITGSGVFNSPRRVYDAIHVPGRNGDLIIGGDSYENIEVTYPCSIAYNFLENLTNFRNALLSKTGYQLLTDSYIPREVRYGCFMDGIEVKPVSSLNAGEFEITFYCKPQRYLISGLETVEATVGMSFHNTTPYNAKPIITVEGFGTLYVRYPDSTQRKIVIQDQFEEVTINSELMDCYSGTANANECVTFDDDSASGYPLFRPGYNYILWVSGEYETQHITKVTVQPRYFVL